MLVLSGSTLALTAAIGVVRFPDTLSRMHAATKPQVLGLLLVLVGAAIRLRGNVDVGMLILTGMFTLITAPVVANRVGQLAYREQNIHDTAHQGRTTRVRRRRNEWPELTTTPGTSPKASARPLWASPGRGHPSRNAECPLFTDPYARLFIDAATARGWSSPLNDETVAELQKADPQLTERMQAMFGYAACRTKYFDEFFIAAGAAGIEQVVILAAGLDARAWRLPWVSGTVVYEIDQPKVLEFKSETLRANDAKPATKYVAVPIDLRQDWPKALRDAGFEPAEPTAWAAEGLLLVFARRRAGSVCSSASKSCRARGSRIAVETFNSEFFDPERLDQRRARMQQMREAAARAGHEMADPEELWFPEERADVADWLGEHGWQVTATEARELMTRYHRDAPDDIEEATPPSIFVDGQLAD